VHLGILTCKHLLNQPIKIYVKETKFHIASTGWPMWHVGIFSATSIISWTVCTFHRVQSVVYIPYGAVNGVHLVGCGQWCISCTVLSTVYILWGVVSGVRPVRCCQWCTSCRVQSAVYIQYGAVSSAHPIGCGQWCTLSSKILSVSTLKLLTSSLQLNCFDNSQKWYMQERTKLCS